HTAKTWRVGSSFGQYFNWYATFKKILIFFINIKVFYRSQFGIDKLLPEGFIFFLAKRAVKIITFPGIITGLGKDNILIQRIILYNRSCRIKEVQVFFPGYSAQAFR